MLHENWLKIVAAPIKLSLSSFHIERLYNTFKTDFKY